MEALREHSKERFVGFAKRPKDISENTLEGEGYKIYNSSCLTMPQIPAKDLSLIFTDPPYFIDGMDDKWDNAKLYKRAKPGVVGGIPAGQKFDSSQGIRLQNFLRKVACECYRALKPGGFMLCFSQARLVHRAAMALEEVGFEIRDIAAWSYEGQAKAFSQNHFVRKMDISEKEKQRIIDDLGGRKTPQLKPRMELIVIAQKPKEGTHIDNWLRWRTGLINTDKPLIEPDCFPANIVPCKKPREKYNHMTVKPVDLCRHFIRIFSSEGDTVLDPFMGTGTTAIAALSEKRRCLGYEIDKAMMDVICRRLAAMAK